MTYRMRSITFARAYLCPTLPFVAGRGHPETTAGEPLFRCRGMTPAQRQAAVEKAPHPNARFRLNATEFLMATWAMPLAEVGRLMERLSLAAINGDWDMLMEQSFIEKVYPGHHARGREPMSSVIRREVFARDGGRCKKCGARERLEVDHVVPWVEGGRHEIKNLQILCRSCNHAKGPLPWSLRRKTLTSSSSDSSSTTMTA